ncbi:MAG TPA: MFS transporter [Gaiellaceae bacterium]
MTLLRLAGRRTFTSLRRHRNYRLFFAGQLASVCGTWMQNIAMYWLVLTLTHSAVAVGVLSLCRFGPFTLFGLVAGVVADRLDNRRTVIVTQSVQMTFSALLAAVTVLGHVQVWQVYAIAFATGSALVLDAPSRQSLTFQMVGRDELPNAVALNSSLFNTARIFGPALAGVLIAAVGAGWCFAINAASFLAVLAGLLAMRVDDLYPLDRRDRPTLWKGSREGFAYARRSRPVKVVLAMMVVFASICFNFNILLPILAKQTLDAGPRTFGVLSACFGAGALVGALGSAALARTSWRVMFAGAAGFGLCELAIAPLRSVALVGMLLFVCGVFFTAYTANSNAAIQLESPDYIRGRVLGLYYYAWNGLAPVGSVLVGWLCAVGGTTLAFSVAGTCALGVTAAAAVAVKRPRDVAQAVRAEPAEQLAA